MIYRTSVENNGSPSKNPDIKTTLAVIFPFLFSKTNTVGDRICQGSLQNSYYSVINFEFVSVSSRFINLKSELYRFATIGDKILIALALIAASGVGISQGGDH